jgi:hypothetical protein
VAYYLVSARTRPEGMEELTRKLSEDAFLHLQPFGRALTRGLRGARVSEEGKALWEEEDYCSPPLAQERSAVLDRYFKDLEVEAVDEGEGWKRIGDLPKLFPDLPRESS